MNWYQLGVKEVLQKLGTSESGLAGVEAGDSLDKARTVAVTTMVFFLFFQAWNSRSELQSIFRIKLLSNPFLFFSMIAAFLAQLSVIYVPALQWVFRTEPITINEWLQNTHGLCLCYSCS